MRREIGSEQMLWLGRTGIIDSYLISLARVLPIEKRIADPLFSGIRVSVVVPAYNEGGVIPRLLESLNKQETLVGFEVVIVDNKSQDQTAQLIGTFKTCVRYPLHLVTEELPGAGNARKTGCDEILRRVKKRDGVSIQYHVIALTDADTVVPPDWIEKISHAVLSDPESIAVSGTHGPKEGMDELIENRLGLSGYFGLAPRVASALEQLIGQQRLRGPNFALEVETYAAASGFCQQVDSLGRVAPRECFDLSQRIRSSGYRIKPLKVTVAVSQRRHLFELLKGTDSYFAHQSDGRFVAVRESEDELLRLSLESVPVEVWKEYQSKILAVVIKNVLVMPLKQGEVNPEVLGNLFSQAELEELFTDLTFLPAEMISEKWAPFIIKLITGP